MKIQKRKILKHFIDGEKRYKNNIFFAHVIDLLTEINHYKVIDQLIMMIDDCKNEKENEISYYNIEI